MHLFVTSLYFLVLSLLALGLPNYLSNFCWSELKHRIRSAQSIHVQRVRRVETKPRRERPKERETSTHARKRGVCIFFQLRRSRQLIGKVGCRKDIGLLAASTNRTNENILASAIEAIERSAEPQLTTETKRLDWKQVDNPLELWSIMEKPTQLTRGPQWRHSLFLFLSCVLLTVVFMAVPRMSNQGAAYFAKQVYYNHGVDRGPHLGQRPHGTDSGSQTKSRRLMAAIKSSSEDHFTGELDRVYKGIWSLH